MAIIVDVKEPKEWKRLADKEDNIQVDYLIVGKNKKYAVERKTISDLFQSVKKGYFWFQLTRLRELASQGFIPIVLIVGSLWNYVTKRKYKGKMKFSRYMSYIGILRGIVNYGCYPVHMPNAEMGKGFLRALNKSAGEDVKYERPQLIQKSNRTLEDEAIDILMAISGVGDKSARELLKEFGCVLNVMKADKKELRKVLKPSVAEHLYDIVRRRIYDTSLDKFIGVKSNGKEENS